MVPRTGSSIMQSWIARTVGGELFSRSHLPGAKRDSRNSELRLPMANWFPCLREKEPGRCHGPPKHAKPMRRVTSPAVCKVKVRRWFFLTAFLVFKTLVPYPHDTAMQTKFASAEI